VKEPFVPRKFRRATIEIIEQANAILEKYAAEGLTLSLRQLFDQFVSRGLTPNTKKKYESLGKHMVKARLAGRVDWEYLEDRTRFVRRNLHFDNPADAMSEIARQYGIDKWADQPERVEVCVEKDALVGVIEGICNELDVGYFVCRGYDSWSEVYRAAQRLREYEQAGQKWSLLHLGDHDPSGVDASRDLQARLTILGATGGAVERIALTMGQVAQYDLPPNPIKELDPGTAKYRERFGDEAWSLMPSNQL